MAQEPKPTRRSCVEIIYLDGVIGFVMITLPEMEALRRLMDRGAVDEVVLNVELEGQMVKQRMTEIVKRMDRK